MSIPIKNGNQKWSIDDFELHRPYLTNFCKNNIVPFIQAENNSINKLLVQAPVKSGKREIVEYLAMRDIQSEHRKHAFLSAFHRIADDEQRQELKIHNLNVFSITTKEKTNKCFEWIKDQFKNNSAIKNFIIVIHLDECDYGSGDKQLLKSIYNFIQDKNKIKIILYSATPQEVLFSGFMDQENQEIINEILYTGEYIKYEPPSGFCGPKKFLENNCIFEAKPFFYFEKSQIIISHQGKEIIQNVKKEVQNKTGKNIIILRLSYSDLNEKSSKKDSKAIYKFLKNWTKIPELAGCFVIVDKSEFNSNIPNVLNEKINWSDKSYWELKTKDIPIIIVIDQTSTRSTEWSCHHRIKAYHDFRNTAIYSTVSQAQERVNHYDLKYDNQFQAIDVYGHLKTFQLSAGLISYEEYINHDWIKKKIQKNKKSNKEDNNCTEESLYKICSKEDITRIHPNYPEPLNEYDADKALQELCCFIDVKLSSRVKGKINYVPEINCEFYECDENSFEILKPIIIKKYNHNFKENSFKESKLKGLKNNKFQGFLRTWDVYDYEKDIVAKPGWGMTNSEARATICYNNNILGIAIRSRSGNLKEINTVETFNSIYKKKNKVNNNGDHRSNVHDD
jgi:hypothetical protein